MRTQSEVGAWRRCAREHQYRYIQLRRSRSDAAALGFGRLIHLLLEKGDLPAEAPQPNLFDLAKANAMLKGYSARWPALDFVAREHTWKKKDRTGNEWGGQFDGVVRRDGRILLLEYKTSSEDILPGSDYWRRVGGALDFQVSMYLWALQGTEWETDTCLYDVLKKPAIRAKRNETLEEFYRRNLEILAAEPETYYQRGEVVRTHDELEAFEEEIAQTAEFMAWAERRGYHPKNPASCLRWGRQCDYIAVCSGQDSIDNDLHFRTADSANEELK